MTGNSDTLLFVVAMVIFAALIAGRDPKTVDCADYCHHMASPRLHVAEQGQDNAKNP